LINLKLAREAKVRRNNAGLKLLAAKLEGIFPCRELFSATARSLIPPRREMCALCYYGGPLPAKGLAVARMIGHITYMSDASMAEKFGRRFKDTKKFLKFDTDFEVEGYLLYRGNNFVKRFDANSRIFI
jgi:homoserine acetyltransferase